MSYVLYLSLTLLAAIGDVANLNCPNNQWIEKSLNNSYIPGAAIVVVNGTHTLYEHAFGYHSISSPQLIDVEKSIFGLASISKTLIATAVMQLVEKELVDLDTDINHYLSEPHRRIFHPKYPSHSITLRKLLSHSSSIAVDDSIELGLYQLGDTAFGQSTLAEALFAHINPNTSNWLPKPPGTVSFYSNGGSSLAGLVVERVTNMSFDLYVKEKIMKPLGVDISKVGVRLADFSNRDELVKHNAYVFNASDFNVWTQGLPQLNVTKLSENFPTWLNIPFFGFSAYPSGLFRMSARSLSKFLQMFMNNGSNLISPKSIAEMKIIVGGGLIPYYDPSGIANASTIALPSFGLSWTWQTLKDGRRYVGHSGTLPGSRHWMLINEKNTVGVIVLSNGDSNVPSDRSKEYYQLLENIHLALFQCFEAELVK
ncbi:unnamed protein product [Rotaria socialis]|uniref:Beta-lactamase-related domain-containing protein n=1 Tax=Rotaria socialis TaxID=392032 RepID=A0A820T2J7_9BILA|nr:unnamed protein product [Rotaria socialis]CAF4464126.1 unnamed protein product [Rotaria socialis]